MQTIYEYHFSLGFPTYSPPFLWYWNWKKSAAVEPGAGDDFFFFYIWVNTIQTGHLKIRNTIKKGGWVTDCSWALKVPEPWKGRSEPRAGLFLQGVLYKKKYILTFLRPETLLSTLFQSFRFHIWKIRTLDVRVPKQPPSLETPDSAIPRYFH